jgi:hypothetical protein
MEETPPPYLVLVLGLAELKTITVRVHLDRF